MKRFLRPPHFGDPDDAYVARLVQAICLTVGTIAVALLVNNVWLGRAVAAGYAAAAVVSSVAVFVLLHRRWLRTAAALIPTLYLALMSLNVASAYGIHDIAMIGFPGVVVLAGLLLGERALFAYAIVTSAVLVAIYLLEVRGLIPEAFTEATDVSDIVNIVLILLITTLLLRLLVGNLNQSLRLSRQQAAERKQLVRELEATRPAGGRVGRRSPSRPAAGRARPPMLMAALRDRFGQDTSQVAVYDRWGNAVVMTPSDFPATPMVPGTGLALGNRMTQFRLDPRDVAALAPGKRPRITPHAVAVTRGDRLRLVYSTPGGDMQPQALVQVFLNLHVFGMDLQQAIDAPRFFSVSAPSSFAPHESRPGTLRLEADLHARAAEGLRDLGYTVVEDPAWDKDFGAVGAILIGDDGRINAGADPREETWADGL